MNTLVDTLPKLWPMFSLPGCRAGGITYGTFSYEDLPSVAADADTQFLWLQEQPIQGACSLQDPGSTVAEMLTRVEQGLADTAGIVLPMPLVTFLRSPDIQSRIRSWTACYLELPEYIVPVAGLENGFLIHFLSDQQWCLHWSLLISQAGEECVICSSEAYGFEDETEEKFTRSNPLDLIQPGICFCAPSLTEFLYRFWIENEIAFKASKFTAAKDKRLTARQQAYIEQYGR